MAPHECNIFDSGELVGNYIFGKEYLFSLSLICIYIHYSSSESEDSDSQSNMAIDHIMSGTHIVADPIQSCRKLI